MEFSTAEFCEKFSQHCVVTQRVVLCYADEEFKIWNDECYRKKSTDELRFDAV